MFARTETAWFLETVWRQASAVLFLHGRIHFHRPDGSRAPANAGAPSVLVAYGDYDAGRLGDCGLDGTVVRWQAEPGHPEDHELRDVPATDQAIRAARPGRPR